MICIKPLEWPTYKFHPFDVDEDGPWHQNAEDYIEAIAYLVYVAKNDCNITYNLKQKQYFYTTDDSEQCYLP